jgi:ABC-2 type transport system permease protein
MKWIVFRHYLKRSLTEPVGLGIITGIPTLLTIILSMVMMNQIPDGVPYMWKGYNIVSTHIAILFMVSFQFFGGNALLDYIHTDFRGNMRWRMFSMPVKPNDYIFGTLAACLVYCLVQGALMIGITAIFLDVYWGNPWILIATLIACAGIAQLLYMLLFLLFPKKGTVEAFAQVLIWVMMFASGWIGSSSESTASGTGTAFNNFLTQYGTPISLARNAITNSGFIGDDRNNALLCLGILYVLLTAITIVVVWVGKKKGFSPDKNAPAISVPVKGLKMSTKSELTIHDAADITKQKELILTAPSGANSSQLAIFKYALLRAYRNPLSIILNAALPLGIILLPGFWQGETPSGFSFIGIALMYGSFVAARGILNDKLDGTITRILSSPVTFLQYLLQNLMAAMAPLTAQILTVGIIGSLLYKWDIIFTLSIMLIYFLFAAASVAFSYAWSCLFKSKETSYAMFSVLMSVVAMLGGLFLPLEILPNALRYIGALFPAFWVSNGILYLQGGNAMGTYWISIAVITMFSILYMVFGSKRRIL